MARWQSLPDSLSPDSRLLVENLRIIKQRSGLSLAGLAARTAHSKSAWHRYLNGDQFPPRTAIEALGPFAGVDVPRLLTLWEAAFRADAELRSTEPTPSPAPQVKAPAGHNRRLEQVVIVLAATVAVLVPAACAVDIPTPATGRPLQESLASCRGETCQGHYASRSGCEQDARTESTVTHAAFAVRLRYSASCAAVWAEVRTQDEGARKVSIKTGPNELLAAYSGKANTGGSSPMLAAPHPRPAEACAEVAGRMACAGLL